jgi:hypothetical protein
MHIPVKRWRGYHRALKRKEPWAIKFSKLSLFSRMMNWVYRDEMIEEAWKNRSWLLDAIGKEQTTSWAGSSFTIPFSVDNKVTFANVEEKKEEEK